MTNIYSFMHTKKIIDLSLSNISDLKNNKYEIVHVGHCAAGWTWPNTVKETVLDCRNECANRPNVGFFAYRSSDDICACYFSKDNCPDDNLHGDFNAYRIVNEGDCRILHTD